MTAVTEPVPGAVTSHAASFAVALACAAGLAVTARVGATALLVAVAVTQALLVVSWVLVTRLPGRYGALVIGALAAAAADVVVSVWPHGQLGTLIAVAGLALPAMIVHQLVRGAARSRVTDSLGLAAMLVVMVVGLPALVQLRHELRGALAGQASSGVAAAIGGALALGLLVDLMAPLPRFDPRVPRGLLAVVAAAGLGSSLGYLLLQSDVERAFSAGRGAFLGASLGAIAALLAVGASYIECNLAAPEAGLARRLRPVIAVVVPLSLTMPVAFVLTLAVRV